MNFKRINNITGWVICLIACTVYIMTAEAGGSLWDCGEFVSSCFKVQIPHPPGAPLFVLLGRIFIVLFGNDPHTAAKGVNVMSALASGFTILFLFWSTTHFARKIVRRDSGDQPFTLGQIVTIMGAGAVGALAYTFSDSFWYSAVEGEVYAMSSFFTAIVFWAILKWENHADEVGGDRWIIFIFFLIGLSIGVHLLCLLCIPAIVMAYYFKRRPTFNYAEVRKYFIWTIVIGGVLGCIMALWGAHQEVKNINIAPDNTMSGLIVVGAIGAIGLLYLIEGMNKAKKEYYGGAYMFFVIGAVILGIVQVGIIQYSIKIAGTFDIFFVNSLGAPFFSGFTVFFIALAIVIWLGLKLAAIKGWSYLRLAIWCITFTLIGYSTYLTTMIRSNADPAVDMYNVDNPQSLVGYLGRDQYGDFPILYGQKFDAQPAAYAKGNDKYQKGDKKYIDIGPDGHYIFQKEDKMIFPRMWDMSEDQGHATYYAQFMNVGKLKDGTWEIDRKDPSIQGPYGQDGTFNPYLRPDFSDNMRFFVGYQTYYMYLRYFFWNFSGKQNDVQGMFTGNVRDGNWITGIPFVDNNLYGDQSLMPQSLQNNKANNKLFMLPFILGLVGMFYQFRKKGDDGLITFLLFFMTGFAIIIYLNQAGFQPRERDYAYVGSFYAFAIWIGLAVPYIVELAGKWDEKMVKYMAICGALCVVLMFGSVSIATSYTSGGLALGFGFALVFAVVAFGLPYILKFLKSPQAIIYSATIVSLLVPIWMGAQEWDDHDRSKKQLARDLAKDYLESCAPNAILFTFGDNDTYPLWYAQEVENIRPDIRVINTSLLGIDWYINQLRYKVNKSDAIDVMWTPAQIEGNNRNYIRYNANPAYPENRYYNLDSIMRYYVGSDDPAKEIDEGDEKLNTFPVRKFSVPVDLATVRANNTVNADDSVVTAVNFDLNKSVLMKNDLALLNIIAVNKWKRPIYFTMDYGELGFGNYVRRDGLSYRLVPVPNSDVKLASTMAELGFSSSAVNTDYMLDKVMTKFSYGNAGLFNVYFDEENRRHLNIMRRADAELALDLAYKNRKDDAIKVLKRSDEGMLQSNFPYGLTSRGNDHNHISMLFLQACYEAGDKELAAKVDSSIRKDLQGQLRFYNSLSGPQAEFMDYEKNGAMQFMNKLTEMEKNSGGTKPPPVVENPIIKTFDTAPKPKPAAKKK